jgi:hypothetical protein
MPVPTDSGWRFLDSVAIVGGSVMIIVFLCVAAVVAIVAILFLLTLAD